MMYYVKNYPFSLLIVAVICYLSFFKPPETDLNEIPYIDKVVHICMYGGLALILWVEYLWRHRAVNRKRLAVGAVVCPVLMSGCIEILQENCTDVRSGDWLDFAANCTGVLLACLAGRYIVYPLLKKYRC